MSAGENNPAASGLNGAAEWVGYLSFAPQLACLAGVGLLPDYAARELAQRIALAWGAVLLASGGAVHWGLAIAGRLPWEASRIGGALLPVPVAAAAVALGGERGLVVLGFRVLEPFIVPLVWACILAFVSLPAHARLLRLCRGRSTVASLLTTTAVSLTVIAPLAWLAVVLRIELIRAYHETQALLAGGLQLPPAVLKLPWLGEELRGLTARAAH